MSAIMLDCKHKINFNELIPLGYFVDVEQTFVNEHSILIHLFQLKADCILPHAAVPILDVKFYPLPC